MEREGSKTVTLAGGLLFLIGFSMLSFYVLPATAFARWSVLVPFSSLLGPDNITIYRTSILALLTVPMLVWYRIPAASVATRRTGTLWVLASIYLGLFAVTAVQTSLNWHEGSYNNCAVVLTALLIGLVCAKLSGGAANVLKVVAVVVVMQALIAIYDLHMGINVLRSGDVVRAGGTFNQPILLYLPIVFILPFVLVWIIRSASPVSLGIGCSCFAILLSALILTGMRGGMFAALISIVFVVHTSFKRWRVSLITFLIVGLLSVGVGFWRSHNAVDAASSTRSNSSRLQVWKRAALVFANHPLSGIGLGTTEIPLDVHSAAHPNKTKLFVALEPKNLVLHWGDELGIGGILLFAWFCYAIAKSLHGCKDDVSIALGGAWLALLVAGMTDTPFGLMDRSSGNVLLGILLGATMLNYAQNSERTEDRRPSSAINEAMHA